MSVLVKDMDMPKSCRDCPFPTEEMWGAYKCQYVHKWGDDENRADDCPLIEIPIPHARLIDENELRNTIRDSCDTVLTYQLIDSCKTVIEAEG